jgi:hypothetical protein
MTLLGKAARTQARLAQTLCGQLAETSQDGAAGEQTEKTKQTPSAQAGSGLAADDG